MESQPTILVVDDEPLQRGSLSLMLQREGYIVTTVEDGLAALAQLEEKKFDIVLTDIRMPRMTGMELLREIKRSNIGSKVILITAYGEIYHAVEAMKAGASNFIERNQFTDERLKSAIKQVLEDRK